MQFDEFAHVRTWWDPESNQRFERDAACLRDAYGSYTVTQTGQKVRLQATAATQQL